MDSGCDVSNLNTTSEQRKSATSDGCPNFYVVSTLGLGWILVLTWATKIFLYNVMILISIRRLVDVDVWFCGRLALVDWTLDFGSVEIWVLVVWTLYFGWVNVGFWLFGRWILVVLILVLGCLDAG